MEAQPLVLVIDDDDDLLRVVHKKLATSGFDVESFTGAETACRRMETAGDRVCAVLTDLRLPGMDGLGVVRHVKSRWADLPVIVMTAEATVTSAVEAIRLGAYDFIEKPFRSPDILSLTLGRAVDRLRLSRQKQALEKQLHRIAGPRTLIGHSPRIRDIFQLIDAVAPTDATALLLGESGTGKELVARAIHDASPRRARAFLPVNCSALPDTLLESELFGYVGGAFTGAKANRIGLFEQASGGTLFLDEIGDISPAMQVRLLRVLQNGEIRPVGSTEVRQVDVRVVAATNRDLQAAMRAGSFREDLYFRLNVVGITLPPLRDRLEDLAPIAQHFLARYSARYGKVISRFDGAALEAMARYPWPGNVRELENTVQRAVVLASSDIITAELLPEGIAGLARKSAPSTVDEPPAELPFALARAEAMGRFERRYLERALLEAGGNMALAARKCQVDKSNFRRLIHRHNLKRQGAARSN